MTVRNLLTVNAIYIGLVALASMLLPAFMLETSGIEVNEITVGLQRVVGSVMVGYVVASWLMRSAPPSAARQAFLLGGGAGYALVAVVFIINSLAGLGNAVMWVYVVLNILLGAAFFNLGSKQSAAE